MNKLKSNLNALEISPDWLSFTVFLDYSVEEIIEFLGFEPELFQSMPRGSNGYRRMLKYKDISILYNGAEGMGIHVNVTGGSIATLLFAYQKKCQIENPFVEENTILYDYVFTQLCTEIRKIGHFTRLDVAIDDFGNHYFSTDDVISLLQQNRVVSKWRTHQNNTEHTINDNLKVGHTIYFGSTQSDIRLRIYDKRLEQNKGLAPDVCSAEDWTRWELQLRGDRADSFVDYLIDGIFFCRVAIGVLSNYLRIINLDDSNRSRCSTQSTWEFFIASVMKLPISPREDFKTLEEEINMFEKQQGRKIAKMLYAHGGSVDYFCDLAKRFEDKLTSHDKQQLGLT